MDDDDENEKDEENKENDDDDPEEGEVIHILIRVYGSMVAATTACETQV